MSWDEEESSISKGVQSKLWAYLHSVQSYWTACAEIICCNIGAQWRSAKNEVIGNEAGIELQGVAEPVI